MRICSMADGKAGGSSRSPIDHLGVENACVSFRPALRSSIKGFSRSAAIVLGQARPIGIPWLSCIPVDRSFRLPTFDFPIAFLRRRRSTGVFPGVGVLSGLLCRSLGFGFFLSLW